MSDLVLEVTAGVGGQEAMLFTAEIFDMYQNFSAFHGWGFDILQVTYSELGWQIWLFLSSINLNNNICLGSFVSGIALVVFMCLDPSFPVVYVVCLGGMRRAAASISGPLSYKKLKFEAGVHRVQRVPKTESKGRIHTSTMTVAILPQPTEVHNTTALIEVQK